MAQGAVPRAPGLGALRRVHSAPLTPRAEGGAVAVEALHSWPHPPDAPRCGHCEALAPEHGKAAALRAAAESARAVLAEVDGPVEPELTEVWHPTLRFFRAGNRWHPEECACGVGTAWGCAVGPAWPEGTLHRPQEAQGIAEWLKRWYSATRLEGEEGAQALMDAGDVVSWLLPGRLGWGQAMGQRSWHLPASQSWAWRTRMWTPSWPWPAMPWT